MKNRTFSQRMGLTSINDIIQLEGISYELRTAIWNHLYETVIKSIDKESKIKIYKSILNERLDRYGDSYFEEKIRILVFEKKWSEVYDFLESLVQLNDEIYDAYNGRFWVEFPSEFNMIFEKFNSGYRFHDNILIPISNEHELSEINQLQENTVNYKLQNVQEHLKQALIHLKPGGDLRNSIKESISMVESIAKIIVPTESSLGKALKHLNKKGSINPLLYDKYTKFYEYANSENGIRHALMDEPNLSIEEARYFLIACSAFTNYLIEKGIKAEKL